VLPPQTPGNPKFVAGLAAMVRDAEMELIFALNFDFNAEVASSIVVYQMNELGLHGRAARNAQPGVLLCDKQLR
jgi:hypothetical protein